MKKSGPRLNRLTMETILFHSFMVLPVSGNRKKKLNKNWMPKQAMEQRAKTQTNYPDSPGNKETLNDLIALVKKFQLVNPTTRLLYKGERWHD